MTRFKELQRIEAAIERKDKPELEWRWATAKCGWGLRRERIIRNTGIASKDEFRTQ